MKRIGGCAFVALMVAFAAQAQELELAPLVPKAPWLKKNQKPAQAKKTKKKKPAAPQATEMKPGAPFVASPPPPLALPPLVPVKPPAAPPPEAALPLALPPLVPLSPVQTPPPLVVSALAVLLQNDGLLDAKSAAQVQDGLQGVAKIAPLTRAAPPAAQPAQPCADDACLASLGAAQKLDQLLVASYARGTLRLKLIDVAAKKSVSEAEQAAVPPEQARAWAEALACRLLVPAGCAAPLGKIPAPLPPRVVPAAAIATAPAAPAARGRGWKRPTAFTTLGVGAAVAAAGLYFGARSHSDIDKAETAFRANGGAYRTADISALNSGNSAARTANTLFAVSGVLLATTALITFAF